MRVEHLNLFGAGNWQQASKLVNALPGILNRTPRWKGEECAVLFLDLSGGLGDFILWSRFLPILVGRGTSLILNYGLGAPHETKRELVEIMLGQTWFDGASIQHGAFEFVPAGTDFWTDMIGLFEIFQVEPETISEYPAPRWLNPSNPDLNKQESSGLAGLCFKAGNVLPEVSRSMSKDQALRIVKATNTQTQFVMLHQENCGIRGAINPTIKSVTELMAILDLCDFVVTVDTFVGHLAGAMQKPTYLMLSGRSSWFWVGSENQTLWYPTMKIFRSPKQTESLDAAIDQLIAGLDNHTTL